MDRHPYLDAPTPVAFAHRGGAAVGAENSLATFQDAVDLGYRYLETDVHATADGVLVVLHDPTLDRVTDRSGPVAALTWDEVRRARIDGREPVPRLEEVLDAFPDVRVNLDVKADGAVAPLTDLLGRRPGVLERVCVGAFAGARVHRLRQAFGARLCTAATPEEIRRLKLASLAPPLLRWLPVRAACVQTPRDHDGTTIVDRRFLAEAHARGLPVHVWTVNDVDEMRRLLDLGVDGLMTDETRALREVLRERGAWRPPCDVGSP